MSGRLHFQKAKRRCRTRPRCTEIPRSRVGNYVGSRENLSSDLNWTAEQSHDDPSATSDMFSCLCSITEPTITRLQDQPGHTFEQIRKKGPRLGSHDGVIAFACLHTTETRRGDVDGPQLRALTAASSFRRRGNRSATIVFRCP